MNPTQQAIYDFVALVGLMTPADQLANAAAIVVVLADLAALAHGATPPPPPPGPPIPAAIKR